jgi:hypothetical protein
LVVRDRTQREAAEATEASRRASAERALVSAARSVAELDLLPPGTQLAKGRFEIVCRLGQGGMGVVYEALDRERNERVALKTLGYAAPAAIYRLKHEFRALLDVHHPNLVQLYELFADGDVWFFTMELLDGKPFDRWLFEQPEADAAHAEAALRNALGQLVTAVRAIHDAGKLHRDLKPSNVLIDASGRLVVLDFGLAASSRGKAQTADDDALMGTPAYMAPEQAAGGRLSEATDYYAIGVMLFEVLTGGNLPFEGALGKVLFTKQTLNAPHPRLLAPEAPRELSELCQQLLAREPAQRPSALAIAARLAKAGASVRLGSGATYVTDPRFRLVGRERELGVLRDAFQASVEGPRPVVLWLRGESGIGKSALCEHFLSGLRREGQTLVLSGRCFERESVPFKAFDAIVDELSRQLRRLPDDDADALLPREAFALARLFPVLKRVSTIAALAERDAADAHDLRRRGFAALGELLTRLREVAPIVIHVDDLQWSDADSNLLLRHLLRQADAPRILCLLSYREARGDVASPLDELHELLRHDPRLDVRALELGPLPDHAARLLAGGEAYSDSALRDARGNPFLLGELTRYAHAHAGPRSVQEALSAHLNQLPSDARRLLELMALCGRPMRLSAVAQAAELSAGGHDAFELLRRGRLARRTSGQLRVECYHDRVREAVMLALTPEQRCAHHRDVALALLALHEDDPEQLALHFEGAGMRQEAAVQAVRAGERALAALAFDQAARFLEKAQLLGDFPETERQRLRVARADALGHGGRGALAGEAYLLAAEHAPEPAEARRLLRHGAEQFLYAGHLERGRELLDRALAPLGFSAPRSSLASMALLAAALLRQKLQPPHFQERTQHAQSDLELLAALRYSSASLTRNDPARGALLSFRYARLAAKLGEPMAWAHVLASRASSAHYGLSDPREVPEALRQSDAIYARVDDAWGYAQRHLSEAAFRLFHCHDPAATLAAAERCGALHEAAFIPYASYDRPLGRMLATMARMRLGQLHTAARELPAQIDDARARNDLGLLPHLLGLPAIARIALEDLSALDLELTETWQARDRVAHSSSVQHMALWLGEMVLCLYREEYERAWARCEREWARLRASPTRRVPAFSQAARLLRAFTALHVAARTTRGAERERLVRVAREDTQVLERIRGGTLQLSRCPSAGVACAQGDRAGAIAALRRDMAALDRDPLYRHGLKRALGLLLGGDEGRVLVDAADDFLRAGGCLKPAQFAALLHPPLFELDATRT